MKKYKEGMLVMGTRNKHGIFKKVKWHPDVIIISIEQYNEYKELKKLKDDIDIKEELSFPRESHCHICKLLYTAYKPSDLLICGNCVAKEMKR